MEKIVEVLAWPTAALIISLVAMHLFRDPIANLIARIRSVSKNGLEIQSGQPIPPVDEKKGTDEFLRNYDNPMVVNEEKQIRDYYKIDPPTDKEKALIRALAVTNINLTFERISNGIWSSQYQCLNFLNLRVAGANVGEINSFYEHAKNQYPTWYVNFPFDSWFGYLRAYNLVDEENSNVSITLRGREFLQFLVAVRKTPPMYG